MFFLVNERGESLGKFRDKEAALAALEELRHDAEYAGEWFAVVELDRHGNRVGEPIDELVSA